MRQGDVECGCSLWPSVPERGMFNNEAASLYFSTLLRTVKGMCLFDPEGQPDDSTPEGSGFLSGREAVAGSGIIHL